MKQGCRTLFVIQNTHDRRPVGQQPWAEGDQIEDADNAQRDADVSKLEHAERGNGRTFVGVFVQCSADDDIGRSADQRAASAEDGRVGEGNEQL